MVQGTDCVTFTVIFFKTYHPLAVIGLRYLDAILISRDGIEIPAALALNAYKRMHAEVCYGCSHKPSGAIPVILECFCNQQQEAYAARKRH